MIIIEEHEESLTVFVFYHLLELALSVGSLVLISYLFSHSNITSNEVVYSRCAMSTLILFLNLYQRDIYVLDVPSD